MSWIDPLLTWAKSHQQLLLWTLAGSAVLFIVAPLLVAAVLVLLPSDYFATKRPPLASFSRQPSLRIALLIAKNLLGIVLLAAGMTMLMVPGPGWLTIFAGVILVDFPGKFRLEHWLVSRPHVSRTINWLRKRAGREPLKKMATATGSRA